MQHRIIIQLALAGVLLFLSNGPGLAQGLGDRDAATEKRNYGDPLPGEDERGAYSQSVPITEAAQSGSVADARGAFLAGESVNSRNRHGSPAVLLAAQAGNIDVLRFLLEKHANPNLAEKSSGKTALIAAAEAGNSNMIRLLLEHKADPDLQDRQGETALMKAVREGGADSVRLLIGAGADVNATDYAGQSIFWHAQDARHGKIAEMIQNAGGS